MSMIQISVRRWEARQL